MNPDQTPDLKRDAFEKMVKIRWPHLSLSTYPGRPDRYGSMETQRLWESWCTARRIA